MEKLWVLKELNSVGLNRKKNSKQVYAKDIIIILICILNIADTNT